MPTPRRQARIGELLQEELSTLIQLEMQDPRLNGVTVTDVQISPDLGHARVYVSVMGEAAAQQDVLRALQRASGFMRRELSARLDLRRVPDFSFYLDKSVARSQRILDLFDRIKSEPGDGSEVEEE
ncbi:MAG: ribosome-binding factor A [Chloroflexi bacterium RBG_16_57_9]|nr:MAG: ribosome-binding factor A [Chloroflexi bacterium RBG_16_57_9]